jgi:hypothetical protein
MSKRNLLFGITAAIFLAFECWAFYFIHIERASTGYDLHYACIIAAAIFSIVTMIIEIMTANENSQTKAEIFLNKSNGNMIRIAMMFTLVADYFLVALTEVKQLHGVIFFLGTQLFIFLHILANDIDIKWRRANIFTRLTLMAILLALGFLVLGKDTDALAIASLIYYANLCTNAIFAHRSGRGGIILTLGLILFGLCDVNVGLSVLDDMYVGGFAEGTLLYKLVHTDVDIIWVFYIPSQTLIPLSILLCDKKRQTG